MTELLLYSGGCPVCRFFAWCISRWDETLRIMPFRDTAAEEFLSDISEDVRFAHWYYIDDCGKRWTGNRGGGLALMRRWRPTRWLANVICFFRCQCLVDKLDDFVKQSRPTLAKVVPAREETRRY